MAEIKYVTEASFRQDVELSSTPVLVDFYADWCGPCKMVQPELEALAASRSDITVAKVNVDENIHLAERFGINSIPCMILFSAGEVKKIIIGYRTKQQLEALISEN
jgi:thioredoxin 1